MARPPTDPSEPASVPAMRAPQATRDNPLTRSVAGVIGLVFLAGMVLLCLATLPWTLRHYNDQNGLGRHLPPSWASPGLGDLSEAVEDETSERARLRAVATRRALGRIAEERGVTLDELVEAEVEPTAEQVRAAAPFYVLGTDVLGRRLFVRCLAGGGISLTIGIAAALLSVIVGTMYGAIAGYVGGRTDALMMRGVDVLYGLPYILLVVLLAVAGGAWVDEFNSRGKVREEWVARQAMEVHRDELRAVLAREIIKRERPGEAVTLEEAEARLAADTAFGGLVGEPTPDDAREFLRQDPDAKAAIEGPVYEAIAYLEAVDTLRKLDQRDELGEPLEHAAAKLGPAPPERDLAVAMKLRPRNLSESTRTTLDLVILLIAIAGVSWLTMARVIRGQVLSLKNQQFMEAARAMGVSVPRQFVRHLLPNLVGPIVVYATLTVPQAILQESFLSFLGIGVKPPLPSWGNLAAEGLVELNDYKSHWWLLFFPCLLLGLTLLALNFVGEGLREAFDPKRARR